ncbi:hypothetical protein EYD45_02385 [Hyunsoonleella flava]|uniref:DUF1579 domain-containing protein n=1 Tax=Hyunsoonleella flava TaxID=2527939 RepID=A0A4Q9FID4_9FLAO|nr:hypothetical protein [Hyunsoonleella flava]TBN06752.1 hypothetical protein EYD45_02385 [Hyunsoonleella flava]
MRIKFLYFLLFVFSIGLTAQESNCNCCTEKHSEFDFWIGSWTVTNPDGTLAGKNIIDKIQDNCILRENWTSAKGNFTGTSNNFYNSTKKQWEQIWIDNQGGNLHLRGNRVGNQMILKTDVAKNKDGQPYYHKVTWTLNEDGSVRQYWETITNDKDVTIAFDGLYKKAEN